MDTLNEYTGYTGRYCREKFKEALGISIKSYANIMRFQNAVRGLFNAQNDDCLSDVVFDNGYFDQSHLNREFRRYSGEPPLSYRREYLSRQIDFNSWMNNPAVKAFKEQISCSVLYNSGRENSDTFVAQSKRR